MLVNINYGCDDTAYMYCGLSLYIGTLKAFGPEKL